MRERILYILACVSLPLAWGWLVALISNHLDIQIKRDTPKSGGNAIHLMATGLQRGYGDPRWVTYKQASDNGWQVRGGEKGTQIEYWEVKRAADKADAVV